MTDYVSGECWLLWRGVTMTKAVDCHHGEIMISGGEQAYICL